LKSFVILFACLEAYGSQVCLEGFASSGGGPGGECENGGPGPFRLLDEQLAGQIGWFLPLAVAGLIAAGWQRYPQLPLGRRHRALVLWGTWLLTMVVFFSTAGQFHRYYTVMLAPAIAALVGAGAVALWNDYLSPGRRGWLLPFSLLGMAALHTYILLVYDDEDWSRWLLYAIAGLCLVAAAGLLILRLRPSLKVSGYYSAGVVATSILTLLIAPTVWATYTVWQDGGRMATAGPQTVQGSSWGGPSGGPPSGHSDRRDTADPALMDYLQVNQGDAKCLVATNNARSASPIILAIGEPDPMTHARWVRWPRSGLQHRPAYQSHRQRLRALLPDLARRSRRTLAERVVELGARQL
jgi:4-amino-4-deoxy-L-arabinose transferase-like glycosyltransferase